MRTRAAGEILSRLAYQYKAARMVSDHFPEAAGQINPPRETWWETMKYFLDLVENAGWFEIDWYTLDFVFESWMNDVDESGYEHDLASYLDGVPVKCYGFSESDLDPCLYILAGLVSDEVQLDSNTLAACELYDNCDAGLKEELRSRLRSEDFSGYHEPLCWLPEMAAIATRTTGNLILDTTIEMYDLWPPQFTWEADLEALRADWQAARPIVEHYKKFVSWFEDPNTAEFRLDLMVAAILGEDDNEER